ncbi:MAG: TRAP transporter large permease [Burkholderiales bacterium]|nr:TRAP transporter large permease [Burkholderiales bacterium]
MDGLTVGIVSIVLIVLLVYVGMYVPVVLMLVSFGGAWVISGNFNVASQLLAIKSAETIASQEFAVIPLFVLMGLLVTSSDVARELFEVANHYLKKILAGLALATVAANAVFAAITGVSIASASVFTKIAVPEMLRYGYNPRFAVGVVAGSSVLGMLIPPSILLIVYAFIVERSVGALFLAAVVPGLLLALGYSVLIFIYGTLWPARVGGKVTVARAGEAEDDINVREAVRRLTPIVALVTVVIGGIYGGIFTPTEAGAVGALGALVMAIAKKRFTWKSFWTVTVDTGHITASISFVIISAGMYSATLGLSGIPNHLESWVTTAGLERSTLIASYILVVLLLGTIMDSISILLIAVPIYLPLLNAAGIDLVWFGVITTIVVEVGLLTPPIGIAVFVIKSTLNDERISTADIFIGALPFAAMMLLVTLLIIAFPGLTRLLG